MQTIIYFPAGGYDHVVLGIYIILNSVYLTASQSAVKADLGHIVLQVINCSSGRKSMVNNRGAEFHGVLVIRVVIQIVFQPVIAHLAAKIPCKFIGYYTGVIMLTLVAVLVNAVSVTRVIGDHGG